MSDESSIRKFALPIGLMVLLLVGVAYGINEFLADEEYIYIGSFKYQIVSRERSDIFQAAHSAANQLGYKSEGDRSVDEMLSTIGYLSYSKEQQEYLLRFSSTEGWDCYEGSLSVLGEKWVKPGIEDLIYFSQEIKKTLRDNAIKIKEDDCESYS